MTLLPRIQLDKSRRAYLAIMVLVLLLAAGLRLLWLEADAPLDLSPSQELNLDGPATIAAGRDMAQFGAWDPYPGPLQPYRYYPAMSWYAYLIFSLLGIGYWQANFLSVIPGFLSVALMAGFAREHFGRRAALFTALFIAANFVYIFYNRNPMAYTTNAFGLALSLNLWGKGIKRPIYYFFAGMVLVFNTLLVKLPGISIAPALAVGFLLLWWPRRRERSLKPFLPSLLFAAGALVMGVIWLLAIYLPNSRVVSQAYYVRTFSQSYTMMDNIRFAIQSVLLFGIDFGFNLRMMPLFLLAYGFLFYRGGQILGRSRPKMAAGEVVAILFLVGSTLMLLFSGIRPLRFQILLIPPMSLVAAMALDKWLRRERLPLPAKFGRLFPIYVQVGVAYLIYQLAAGLVMLGRAAQFGAGPVDERVALSISTLYNLLFAGIILAIGATFAFIWRVVQAKRPYIPLPAAKTRLLLGLMLLGLALGGDLFQYWTWARDPQFSIVTASRQIGRDFEAGSTILAGSYAYTLGLESGLPAVWFYGQSPGEAILNSEFTHIAVESASPLSQDNTNEARLRQNLPDLMDRAILVKSYELRAYQVSVYEVSR